MTLYRLAGLVAAGFVAGLLGAGGALAAQLTIESWRSDDAAIWRERIIRAFEAAHPAIAVKFTPTAPTEYNAALNVRLTGGVAGDLITCRPFDASLKLFEQGHLVALNDLDGLENFDDVAKSAWTTDDGATTFCLPLASVIHGFIYNADIFQELGLEEPNTVAEFFRVLDRLAQEGGVTPMALGIADQWEAATMGFQNIGPNYWLGEAGRKALISGEGRFTDTAYIEAFAQLARWGEYLGRGFSAQSYADSQTLFTLGRAAIYPAGSWEIAALREQADFALGAFPPPVPAGAEKCYISDHTDIGIGINAASPEIDAARTFLDWLSGSEFATIFANALPGFFPLSNHALEIDDPLAREFLSWRQTCEPTIRNSYQILSRGTPNLETDLWTVSTQVIAGAMTPKAAAEKLQAGLEAWYGPQQR